MTSGSAAHAADERDADALHIASAVSVAASGGELSLLSSRDGSIVLSVGVEATRSPPSMLRYLKILNNTTLSLAAVQRAGGREEQVMLAPGATTIALGAVTDAACSAQIQIGPIPPAAFAQTGARVGGVLSLFVSAEPAIDSGAEVSFLGQAISHPGR